MAKFKVLAGPHVHSGRVYSKGDIIESEHDLAATWRNSFARVPDDEEASAGKRQQVIGEVIGGSPNQPPAEPAVNEDEGEVETDQSGKSGPLGTEVTKNFPKAIEQDFKVFKHESQYLIYNAEDLTKPIDGCPVAKAGVNALIEKELAKTEGK
jgi:hypothetical protein